MVLIKLSIVTITFNNFKELKKSVASVFEQILTNYFVELVIINGGSCKLTLEYLANLKSPQKNIYIKAISGPDSGIADAFNKGLDNSTGELIIYLNSGDLLIDKNYLANAINLLDQNSDATFAHAQVIFTDKLVGPLLMVPRMYNVGRGMPYYHQTMICKRNAIIQVGGFNTNFRITMDYDLVVRMHKLNMRGIYYPHPVVEMDGGGISAIREWLSIKESKMSMINNGVFDYIHKFYFYKRLVFYFIRKVLTIFHLNFLLAGLKKISNTLRAKISH
ncbi:MAG: glycosyltransferase [Bacteriovoracaceae bacterium]